MLTPYYQDSAVTLYLGDCREILPALELRPDCLASDPPYSAQTHAGARSPNKSGGDRDGGVIINYPPVSAADIRAVLGGPWRASRWTVCTVDYHHAAALEAEPPPGLRFVRFGIWDKGETGAPQITGDRPATGWEAIAILHADTPGRMRWNGGGKDSVYHHAIARGAIPEEKPTTLLAELISDFTDPGDLILDPWCGHATTLRVAKDLGRRAVGIEIDEARCEYAARRLAQESLFTPRPPAPVQVAMGDWPKVRRS